MLAISASMLPAIVGVGVLSIAAVSQLVARRVPNVLTLTAIAGAWLFAISVDAGHRAPLPGPALQASFLDACVALAIMFPIYQTKKLGAGCVKAQMAFAAWVGCAIPLAPSLAFVACATIGGMVFTFASACLIAEDLRSRRVYEFPAQVTMSVIGIGGAIGWAVTHLA
jgi:Flp pilus assembly protein protease CpaA